MENYKTNLDILEKPYRFNMVNSNDNNLKKLGLVPLYYTVYPRYINLEDQIFYLEKGLLHYECNLSNDIERILRIMNSNTYERFKPVFGFLNDDYQIHFSICNNQIFFDDEWSLSIYKHNLTIRNEINKEFNLKKEFYEPTSEEIKQDYALEYFRKNGAEYEWHNLNLTPQEYFKMMISSKRWELSPYTNANELDAYDIRSWLNYNANIFMNHKCPRETKGIYNEETMAYINLLKETKLEIYNFFDHFASQAKEWQKVVKELLIEFGVYSEFIPKEESDNPFFDDNAYAERSYWDTMFARASADIFVQFVGFDKIETQLSQTITTSKPNIYEEFFNPIIMGYDVVQLPRLIFDEEKQELRWIHPSEFTNTGINRECENEIKQIKKYVPFDERYKHLRF